jgi:hypothetical protein
MVHMFQNNRQVRTGHNVLKSSSPYAPSTVLDSSSFAPILMLPHRTCLHSASSVVAVRIKCHDIEVFVF